MSEAGQIAERIRTGGILAVIRQGSAEDFLPAVAALQEGGVCAVECALGEPSRLHALEAVRARFGRNLLIGAGTIRTADAATEAIRAGAQFLAASMLNPDVVRVGLERDVPVIPGAFTATEVTKAWEMGASLVKLFPAGSVGPAYVRDLRGPLPYIPLIPSGGITLETAPAFLRAGAAAVAVGNELMPQDLVARRAFGEITTRARAFVEAVQRARERAGVPVPPVKLIEGPDTR